MHQGSAFFIPGVFLAEEQEKKLHGFRTVSRETNYTNDLTAQTLGHRPMQAGVSELPRRSEPHRNQNKKQEFSPRQTSLTGKNFAQAHATNLKHKPAVFR